MRPSSSRSSPAPLLGAELLGRAATRRLSRCTERRGRRRTRTRAHRRVRVRRELRHDGDRLLRQREGRHVRRECDEDRGALRVGRLAERLVGARRPSGTRDVLQGGIHARGLGEAARGRDRRDRPGKLGRRRRRRPDDLGRPPRGPLPPDAQQGRGRRLPRLGPGSGRRAVAAPRRDLRRRRGALLRGRRPDGEQGIHRQRRGLEHLARRRVRAGAGRLLRRRDRRGAGLRPRALGDGDPDGHGRAGRRPGRNASERAGELRADELDRIRDRDVLAAVHGQRRRHRLPRLPRRRLGRGGSRDDLHLHRPRLRHALLVRRRGARRGRERFRAYDALEPDGRVQSAAADGSRGRVPLRRRGRRHRDGRLRPRPDGDRGRSGLDGRALRLGALVQRLGRAGRRSGARHLLQDGLHVRGLGQAAVGRIRCGRSSEAGAAPTTAAR